MKRIGAYRIDSHLDVGGFATVWQGWDDALDGPVAIKVLADNWSLDSGVRDRFVAEARALWKISDPRIVRVFALGETDGGQPWFAMEFADRGTLADRLTAIGAPADLATGVKVVEELAECIDALHRVGLLHRDIKPDNFLIISDNNGGPLDWFGNDERVVIGDLGQSKTLAAASGFTMATGTPGWVAPEQRMMNHGLTTSADVYSLAKVAAHILAPSLASAPTDQRSRIEELIANATAEDPAVRPTSAVEFAQSLVAAGTEAAPGAAGPDMLAAAPAAALPVSGAPWPAIFYGSAIILGLIGLVLIFRSLGFV